MIMGLVSSQKDPSSEAIETSYQEQQNDLREEKRPRWSLHSRPPGRASVSSAFSASSAPGLERFENAR
jgi:hypothetical protein